jgi:putative ABC transport system substrate-binding protein
VAYLALKDDWESPTLWLCRGYQQRGRTVLMTSVIDRRAFLAGSGAVFLAAPLAAEAQQPKKAWRLGLLFPVMTRGAGPSWLGFEQKLRDLGYVEGQNLTFEYGAVALGTEEDLTAAARSFVRRNVDLILTAGMSEARAAKKATSTTPIVMLQVFDAVESGLVASLARPGANITGISLPYLEVAAKQLELLQAALPEAKRVAFLTTGTRGGEEAAVRAMAAAAGSLGLKLATYQVNPSRPRELDRAFASMKTTRVQALAVSQAGELFPDIRRIATLALIHRLPGIGGRLLVDNGGLVSFGPSMSEGFERAATYVDKILRGAQPADLPVEQPTRFELVINLKTAKALGLTIPPSLLGRADEILH